MSPYRFDVISLAPKPFTALSELGVIGRAFLEKIAEIKMSDLNANTIEQAKEMIRGTARSMGLEVKG